jgi:hypothetical protein
MAGGVRDPPYQEPLPAFSQTGLPDDASPGRRRPRHHRLAAPASAAFTGHRSSESETRTHHGSDQTLHSALSAGLDGLLRRLHRLAPAPSEGGPGQPGGGHVTARRIPYFGTRRQPPGLIEHPGEGRRTAELRSSRCRPLAGRGVSTVVGCSRSIGVRSSQAVQMSVPPPIPRGGLPSATWIQVEPDVGVRTWRQDS